MNPQLLPGNDGNGEPVTLGVMGGGQLGRMFVHAAQAMGYATAVLDPDAASPAGRVSHHHIKTDYLDPKGLATLAKSCVAITTEFENVPAQALLTLARTRPVAPAAQAVRIAQDRAAEKAHFVRCGVPCAPYAVIETPEQLQAVDRTLLPGILKTARMGYDGKGQMRVKNRAELATAWDELKRVPCVLEKKLALIAECSVIIARGADGVCVNLPVQRNLHRDGILALTEVFKGNMPAAITRRAVSASKSIANELQYVGVLCVEFFVVSDAASGGAAAKASGKKEKLRLVVNEIAPRPHNSGHYSMNACDVSQFELQVRTLAGLPLTQPRQHSPAIMLNLLGDLWFERKNGRLKNWGQIPIQDSHLTGDKKQPSKLDSDPNSFSPAWDKILALPGTHLHLYGKTEPRKGRKMGHLNITGPTVEAVRATAAQAAKILGIKPFSKEVAL
jgi:5-(carboxyamino)imidazole ribonucleotide synthase